MTETSDDSYFAYAANIDEVLAAGDANGGIISPGGVAMALGCSRQNVRLLEARGKILGYRMRPHRAGLLHTLISTRSGSRRHEEVFILVDSVRQYAADHGITLHGVLANRS